MLNVNLMLLSNTKIYFLNFENLSVQQLLSQVKKVANCHNVNI